MARDTEVLPFEIPLDGKLNTADSPTLIDKNFSSLKNLRYDELNPKGVSGMTKINSSNALDSDHQHAQNAFHFVKDSPVESHVLVQTVDTSDANPTIVQNTTAIPNTGDFEGGGTTSDLYVEDTSAGIARFSDAPNGQVVICDGKESLIWGGDESRVSSALASNGTITTTLTSPKDYSSKVLNSSQDSDQRMLIRDGTANTVLLLHCEGADASTTFTDSSPTVHVQTAVGDAQIDTDQLKFGSSSGLLDGTGDYVTVPDHAEFDFSDEDYAIDTWVRPVQGNTPPYTIYLKRSDASNWMKFYLNSYTSLLLHGDGTDGDTTITDSSSTGHSITGTGTVNQPEIDTAQSVFGGSSILFDRSDGRALQISDHADFDLSGQIFTVDFRVRFSSISQAENQYIFDFHDATANTQFSAWLGTDNILDFFIQDSGSSQTISSNSTLSIDTWYHIRFTADGSKYYLFIDGTLQNVGGTAISIATLNYDQNLYIGNNNTNQTLLGLDGWIDEFRLLNGKATHTSDFTPSTSRYEPLFPSFDLRIGGSTETLEPDSFDGTIDFDTWHHVQLDADGTSHYLFADGVLQNSGGTNLTNTVIDFTQKAFIGVHNSDNGADPATTLSDYFNGWFDEFRIKSVGEKTADFTPQTQAYSLAYLDFLIGSTRPLKGCKFYIPSGDGNSITSTLSMKEWNGASWTSITISDGTTSGGISLAQTGSVAWSSTVDTSKIRYFEGYLLYWYNFTLSAGSADIYQVTVDAPVQKVLDIWDSVLRSIFSYQVFFTPNFNDNTVNVSDSSYDTGNTATFVELDALATATDYQYIGSLERLTGIEIRMIGGHENTTAASTLTLSYWDGSAWIDVTNLIDGTSEGSITFAKSGVITWHTPDEVAEFKTQIAGGIPLYFYRLHSDTNFSADVQLYYIAGIPAQNRIGNYRFPLLADNCLWLCDDINGKRNEVLRSFPEAPDVFNGTESFRIAFGDEKKLIGATVLNTRKDDNVFDVKLFFKNNSMHGLTGFDQDSYRQFEISRTIGCPAPLTIATTILESEDNVFPIAIWQGSNGIYIYNDFKPMPIHRDIRNFFDKNESSAKRINKSYIANSVGFVDEEKREYHWLFSDGDSTGTLNREFVFDLRRFRWFEIPRGTGKELQCGITTEDTEGNNYNYGFIDTGYMERLENGTTFDGTAITHELQIGHNVLYKESSMFETIIRYFKLIMKTKSTTTNTATVTHYGDGNNTGTIIDSDNGFDPTKSGHEFTDIVKSVNLGNHVQHSIKLTMETDDETVGFEPLRIGGFYKLVRSDKR